MAAEYIDLGISLEDELALRVFCDTLPNDVNALRSTAISMRILYLQEKTRRQQLEAEMERLRKPRRVVLPPIKKKVVQYDSGICPELGRIEWLLRLIQGTIRAEEALQGPMVGQHTLLEACQRRLGELDRLFVFLLKEAAVVAHRHGGALRSGLRDGQIYLEFIEVEDAGDSATEG